MGVARDVFEVLADPTRRRILELLRDGEHTVGELVGALDTAQPNVSKHLKMLDAAALVQVRVDGPRRHYALAAARLREIDAWLAPFREIWADRLDQLEGYLDTMPDEPEE
ncbi:winged helix-turn-helix transcriptional regulator [Nocardia flavorosea]|nr:winged helix-turn-helix transcriptional regulator [Nocardia flavorosea]